jgi:hypothetical protein
MYLFVPPVVLPRLPETHDPALHGATLGVLFPLGEHGPVLPHAEPPGSGTWRHLARTEHVEDEDAAGDERAVNAPEETAQSPFLVLGIEKVVEDLADRRDRGARRDPDLEQRPDPELGLGRPAAGDLDHRLGDIYAEHEIAGVDQLPRQEATPAAEVDDEAIAYFALFQYLQYAGRGSERELGMADIMNVGDVLPVPARRIGAFRGYLSPP